MMIMLPVLLTRLTAFQGLGSGDFLCHCPRKRSSVWCDCVLTFIYVYLLGFGEAWTDASYVQLVGLLVRLINKK